MSDAEQVSQALAELWDIVKCRCHEAYTGRGLHDPDCQCDSTDAVQTVADRIEALTKERDQHWDSFVHWRKEADGRSEQLAAARQDAKEAEAYAEELEKDRDALEAKLASGVVAEYDDGSIVCLSGYAGGAAVGGAWSTLTLMEVAPDGAIRERKYKAQGDWCATLAEIKGESHE